MQGIHGEYSSEPLGDYFAVLIMFCRQMVQQSSFHRKLLMISSKIGIIYYSKGTEPVYKDIVAFAKSSSLQHANSISVRFE